MGRATRTPAAEEDLLEIAYYIAVEGSRPAAAERAIDELIAKCQTLADFPNLGEAAPQLGANYRVSPLKRWVIIYCPTDDGIEVLRIVDGARDYPHLFDKGRH